MTDQTEIQDNSIANERGHDIEASNEAAQKSGVANDIEELEILDVSEFLSPPTPPGRVQGRRSCRRKPGRRFLTRRGNLCIGEIYYSRAGWGSGRNRFKWSIEQEKGSFDRANQAT
jgi:hypothetical protein